MLPAIANKGGRGTGEDGGGHHNHHDDEHLPPINGDDEEQQAILMVRSQNDGFEAPFEASTLE